MIEYRLVIDMALNYYCFELECVQQMGSIKGVSLEKRLVPVLVKISNINYKIHQKLVNEEAPSY